MYLQLPSSKFIYDSQGRSRLTDHCPPLRKCSRILWIAGDFKIGLLYGRHPTPHLLSCFNLNSTPQSLPISTHPPPRSHNCGVPRVCSASRSAPHYSQTSSLSFRCSCKTQSLRSPAASFAHKVPIHAVTGSVCLHTLLIGHILADSFPVW